MGTTDSSKTYALSAVDAQTFGFRGMPRTVLMGCPTASFDRGCGRFMPQNMLVDGTIAQYLVHVGCYIGCAYTTCAQLPAGCCISRFQRSPRCAYVSLHMSFPAHRYVVFVYGGIRNELILEQVPPILVPSCR